MTQPLEHVTFEKPDEVREGDNWRLELLNLAGGAQVGRITVQPGWRWTEDVKPVAGADPCQAPPPQYQGSGRPPATLAGRARPGGGARGGTPLPPGHQAWG